jgi:hypothetical protein
MSKYVVFVTEDEDAWEAKSDLERQQVYDADARFVAALAARGGKVISGAELAPTSTWHTLTHRGGVTRHTQGPYAESVEQLGGFYVVECADVETLVAACAEMAAAHVRLEIAPAPD